MNAKENRKSIRPDFTNSVITPEKITTFRSFCNEYVDMEFCVTLELKLGSQTHHDDFYEPEYEGYFGNFVDYFTDYLCENGHPMTVNDLLDKNDLILLTPVFDVYDNFVSYALLVSDMGHYFSPEELDNDLVGIFTASFDLCFILPNPKNYHTIYSGFFMDQDSIYESGEERKDMRRWFKTHNEDVFYNTPAGTEFRKKIARKFREEANADGWLKVRLGESDDPLQISDIVGAYTISKKLFDEMSAVKLVAIKTKPEDGLDAWEVNEEMREIFEHFFAKPYREPNATEAK